MKYNTIKDALLVSAVVVSNHFWDFWNPLNTLQMVVTYISMFIIAAAILMGVDGLQEEKAPQSGNSKGADKNKAKHFNYNPEREEMSRRCH